MQNYLDLLDDTLHNGCDKPDRTGVGTRSVFGRQLRFDLRDGFPCLTTKKLHLRSIIYELLWFLRGDTNVAYLQQHGVKIWDAWADERGDLGPIYGAQWRRALGSQQVVKATPRVGPPKGELVLPSMDPPAGMTPAKEDAICGYTLLGRDQSRYVIRFPTGGVVSITRDHVLTGNVRDPYAASVAGMGVVGPRAPRGREYHLWRSVINRCYAPSQVTYPAYGGKGVYVAPRWLYFPSFAEDLSRLPGYEQWRRGEAYELDKDHFGGECYSTETCAFIPKWYNTELSGRTVTVGSKTYMCPRHAAEGENTTKRTVQRWLHVGQKPDGTPVTRPEGFYRRQMYVDQIGDLVRSLQDDHASRRHVIDTWSVPDLPSMALAPCHSHVQFYVAEGRLSCQLYQRSADLFLGVPFNIASYSLLLLMIAKVCDLAPGELVHTFGDAHLYANHFEQARMQLSRTPKSLPRMIIKRKPASVFDYRYEDFELRGYEPHPHIKANVAI